jgi:hypothetical protein
MNDVLQRQNGEPAEAWLARLKATDRDLLTMLQRIDLSHLKEQAEKAVAREKPCPATDALQEAREAYLRLSAGDRQLFIRWLAAQAAAERP